MEHSRKLPIVIVVAAVIVVLTALHFAEPVLMPLAFAMLLSVVLTPAVKRIERLGIGRVASVILIALLVSGSIAGVGWVVFGQVGQLATLLPDYRDNVREKLSSVKQQIVSLERAVRRVQELEEELAAATPAEETREAPPVKVVQSYSGPLDVVRNYLGSVAGPLGTVGLVIVMVVFLLIQREDLRDRLIRVVGSRDLMLTTNAMDDVSDRVSRYLRAYTMLNMGHGVVVALGLWLIGLPAALLFGVIAFMLRFIPYVGPWVAALLPVALSVAVFEDWTSTLLVIGYLAGVELISNNVFEPLVYGASVGLSPFAIIVAAVFWAWIWGPVGLVLAIPLTVCVVVLGRYVPQLRFLVVLLGDEPALAPPVRLFQRLLANDVDEADDLVETACTEQGIDHACDTIVLPALALVDYERRLGRLDEEQLDTVRQTFDVVATTIEECGVKRGECLVSPESDAQPDRMALCLPAGAFGDEIACKLVACLLARCGARVTALPRLLTGEMIHRIAVERPDVVLLSALPPTAPRTVRFLCRRLLGETPEFQLVIGMWGAHEEAAELRSQFEDQPVRVVSSFEDARRIIGDRLRASEEANGARESDTGRDATHNGSASAEDEQRLADLRTERKRARARRPRSTHSPARR